MDNTPNILAVRFGININVDRENWVYYILSGQKTIETRPASVAGQWRRHVGERIGLIRTTSKKGNLPTGLLVGTALLVEVRDYKTKEDFDKDLQKHFYKCPNGWENDRRCGLVLREVSVFDRPLLLKPPKHFGTVREIEFM